MKTAIIITLFLAACSTIDGGSTSRTMENTGGQSLETAAALAVTIKPTGEVEIRDSRTLAAATMPTVRETTATTQASASSYGALPAVGRGGEGRLGAVTFEEVKSNAANVRILALAALFIAAAGVWWFLFRNPLAALVCLALAVLTVLWPTATAICAIVVLVAIAWASRKVLRQLVIGIENVKAAPGAISAQLERAQDDTTKAVVRALRGKG